MLIIRKKKTRPRTKRGRAVFIGGYTMGHHHSHLTKTDRYKIEALLNHNATVKEIAGEIGVHISTIYREIKRARMVQLTTDLVEVEKYNPDGAEKRYRENLKAKGPTLKIGNDFELAEYIENKIVKEHYSPAAALHAIELENKHFKTTICVNTLYSYIYKGVFLTMTLEHLPDRPKRKKRKRKVQTVKRPPAGDSIEKRPPEVAERNTFGHWEMDTVYGDKEASKDCLLTLTERLTRKHISEKMPDRTDESAVRALDRIERRYGDRFRLIFKTITVDNGGEFSDREGLERSAIHEREKRTKFYYCHPYRSSERGSNENQNRMVRRGFPKGTDFAQISEEEIKAHESWINNYPREILGWKTSEMFFLECVAALLEPVK